MTETAIADHGLIGDLQTAALVTTDGIGRLVLLPAVRLAERLRRRCSTTSAAGTSGSAPTATDYVTKQLYFPDTAILITRFMTEAGVGEVVDFMPPAGRTATDQPPPGPDGAVRARRDALRGRHRAAVRLRPRKPTETAA